MGKEGIREIAGHGEPCRPGDGPLNSCTEVLTLAPQKGTLFGNRAVAGVISSDEVTLKKEWALIQHDRVLIQMGNLDTDACRETPREDEEIRVMLSQIKNVKDGLQSSSS